MDTSRTIGILLGHSFVSGLSDHFSQCGRHVVTAAYIAHQLSISDRVDEFHLVGTRGARVLQGLQAHAHDALTTIRPTFAIVDIGTNDISNGAPTVTVADAVVQLAHEIIDVFGARHVTVCSALHRSSPLDTNNRHINNLIDNYNNILRNFCDVEPLIDYHTHRGFWNTDTYTWSRDGLHPNTNVGRAKYKRSLRKAVNHALSVVHKPKCRHAETTASQTRTSDDPCKNSRLQLCSTNHHITRDVHQATKPSRYSCSRAVHQGMSPSPSSRTNDGHTCGFYCSCQRRHIKELMRSGANWRYYDHQFRVDREYSLCSWAAVRVDLQLTATLNKPTFTPHNTQPFLPARSFRANTPRQQQNRPPPGYCYNYHSQYVRCTTDNCQYKHACPKCNRSHPMYRSCFTQVTTTILQHYGMRTQPHPIPDDLKPDNFNLL
ncbi:hypothetical protein LSAT2_014989 [Lamellibrachia satsuma]|nr:hypothetical protein LSAT2_014989 [Lamellibrachia satsuma]